MMNANNYDIVKAGWLLKCVDAGHFIPWYVREYIAFLSCPSRPQGYKTFFMLN